MNWLHDLLGETAARGLAPANGVTTDGLLHRFRVDGDKPGSRNGWYVVHADDHPTAVFGSWKTGAQHTWRASAPSHDTGETKRQHIAVEQRRRQAEETRTHADAAARARRIWDQALDPDPSHRYLRGKAIRPYGIRQHQDALVVPLKDIAGKLFSLQFIAPDGHKRFLRGGRVKGLFDVIGPRTPRVWLCEGYATGASLHEDRRECVVIAFNCDNLLAVAESIVKGWRPQSLTVMADDDWQTPGNPGVAAAREVSDKLNLD
ncbi:MAG: hypothetical protein HYX63_16575 [Gammaproteobacteria bacterium]|nr:hypothetical protein [Gammaproteobacteria bacterium]